MQYLNSRSILPWLKDTLKPYGETDYYSFLYQGAYCVPSSFKDELRLPLEALKNIILGRVEFPTCGAYRVDELVDLCQRKRSFAAVMDGLVQLLGSLFLVVRIPVRLMVTIGTKLATFFRKSSPSQGFHTGGGGGGGGDGAVWGHSYDEAGHSVADREAAQALYSGGGGGGCSAAEELAAARDQKYCALRSAAGGRARALDNHLIADILGTKAAETILRYR